MPQEEPSRLVQVLGLFYPGGDPEEIRRAEAACRQLSSGLGSTSLDLEPVLAGLRDQWKGQDGTAFREAMDQFTTQLGTYVEQLGETADGLAAMADLIDDCQRQAHVFYVMIGAAVAIGAAYIVFSAGISAAASLAVVASGRAGLAALAVRMAFLVSGEAAAMAALQSALLTTTALMTMGMGFSWLASAYVKGVVQDLDIRDPASWNASDANKLLLDGVFVLGMGMVARLPAIARQLAGPGGTPSLLRNAAGGMAFCAPASGMFSFVSQFAFHGKSLTDMEAWKLVGVSSIVGGISGLTSAGAVYGPASAWRYLRGTGNAIPRTATVRAPRMHPVRVGNLQRSSAALPSETINYFINYPEPAQPPQLPPLGPAPVAPSLTLSSS